MLIIPKFSCNWNPPFVIKSTQANKNNFFADYLYWRCQLIMCHDDFYKTIQSRRFGVSNKWKHSEDLLQSRIDRKNCCCKLITGAFGRDEMVRSNPSQKFQGVEKYHLFMCTLDLVQWQMSFLFQVLTATMVTYSLTYFCYLYKIPNFRLDFIG